MSKALAIGATGVGGGGAAIGGYYMVKEGVFSSGSKEEEKDKPAETEEVTVTQSSTLLTEWKNSSPSTAVCVKTFSGLKDLKAEGEDIKTINGSENKIDKNFFNATEDNASSQGCLAFGWTKQTVADGSNWNGTFKLTWTFEKENKGFIVFLAAKEVEKGKLGLVGLFYSLSKTGDNWSITHKKEVTEHKEITSSTAPTHFPKVGNLLTDLASKPWWEWFTAESEIAKVCVPTAEDCKNLSESSHKNQSWNWTKATADTAGKLSEWSENLKDWWKNLFSDGEISIPEMVEEEKAAMTVEDLVASK